MMGQVRKMVSFNARRRILSLGTVLLVPLLLLGTVQAGPLEPSLVRDIRPDGQGSNPGSMAAAGGILFFRANDGVKGEELWRSGGSEASTTPVLDINPGGDSSPNELTVLGSRVFFRADDGTFGRELWVSDGTAEGTERVMDISPGNGSSYPSGITAVGNRLFFHADDGTMGHGRELWETNGTTIGTALVRDIYPGSTGSNPGNVTRLGDFVLFTAEDGIDGNELWRSDGRAAGTMKVRDIKDGPSGSYPEGLVVVKNTVYFSADDGQNGRELWKSDGSEAGTVMVKDIKAGGGSSNPEALTEVNGVLVFSADAGTGYGQELWRSDGTAGGTYMVKDINTGSGSSTPDYFVPLSNASFQGALFAANDGSGRHGYELWRSDGTAAGTSLVRDINTGGNSYPESLTVLGKWVFFSADDGASQHGRELWRSDGTAAGTTLVADINPGSAPSQPQSLEPGDGVLYFSADDGVRGAELWALWAFAPDLVMVKTAAPATVVAPGGSLVYRLTYANDGDSSAGDVVITDILPQELAQVRVESDRNLTPVAGYTYRWQVGSLAPGEGGVITISGVVQPARSKGYAFGNTAEIGSTSAESNMSNNSSSMEVAINFPPVGVVDGYTTKEDTKLKISAPGILANDSDADGQPLNAVLDAAPTVGNLQMQANGSFDYTPPLNYHGKVTFDYHAHDGTFGSGQTRVTIDVTSVNDVPVAVDDGYRTTEDATKTVPAPGVLGNDRDDDGDPLTAVLDRAPDEGILDLRDDGSFTYTPAPDSSGTFSFTYHAYDGKAESSQARVILEVAGANDAPAASDDGYVFKEDKQLVVAAPGILENDKDPDGDDLTAVLDAAPASGILALEPDGAFVYTPAPNFHGTVSFVYHTTDGIESSNQATVTLEVVSANDLPVAQDDNYKTLGNNVRRVAAPGVLANDRDVEGDLLTAVLDRGPEEGDLVFNPDGSFVYTPNPGSVGRYTFKYHAYDGDGDSEQATVTLTVASDNLLPEARGDAYSTAEESKLVVEAPGLLGNDDDPDQDLLSAWLSTAPAHGDLLLDSDGSFVYMPALDFSGVVSFTYRAYDGLEQSPEATVRVTVTQVNDAPVAVEDHYWTSDEKPLTIPLPGVLGNDLDVDRDSLKAMLDAPPREGDLTFKEDGSFTYVPVKGKYSTFAFTYRASDGMVSSQSATVTIHVVEVMPVFLPLLLR